MTKTFLVIGALFAAILFFYGAVSALVNQGHPLGSALITFVLVVAGAALLIWVVKPK